MFWTRITNETENPFEFSIEFSEDAYQLFSSPGRFFKIFIPSDSMTIDKEALFNYGLDVDGYLNHDSNNQGKLIKNINPKNNYTFYVLTLFNKGVEGTLRTELKIDKQKLTYRINDKEIDCGDINGKQL